jgi:hypothetical protein
MRLKRWTAALAALILAGTLWAPPALAADDTPVTLDNSLKAALVDIGALADSAADPTVDELKAITGSLDLSGQGITGLAGIAALTEITDLDLSGNELKSLAPLAGMTWLKTLGVDGNWLDLSAGSADRALLDSLTAGGCAVSEGTQRVPATGLSLSQTEAGLCPGESLTLTATVQPADAVDKTVTWASGDTGVLTVADGVVSAVGPGTTTVTASIRGGTITAECNVVVKTTSIVSDIYGLGGGVLSGVAKNTSVDELVGNLGNSASDIAVYKKTGEAYAGGAVATGMTVRLTIGGVLRDTKTIAVSGDVNGDGMITVADYTHVRLHLLEINPLTGASLAAADANNDGKLSIADYTVIRVDIAGLKAIIGTAPDLPEVSDKRIRKFLDLALAQLGKPYVWGAEGPDEFDCSGFVWYCLTKTGGYTGKGVWRATANTYSNWSAWPYVSKDQLQPGDLMFYFSDNPNDGAHIGHIGIYLGNGYHVHASSDNGRIVISRIEGWYAQMLSHGRRAYN